jgi:hypothetical protein
MTARVNKRAAASRAADKVLAQEVALAEERGAARARARIRAAVAEHRRVVRVGGQQVEVVETAALQDVLAD